jgi:hypothetical protein
MKWRQGCQDFILLLVSLKAEVRKCFSKKVVKLPVTIFLIKKMRAGREARVIEGLPSMQRPYVEIPIQQ